MKSSRILCILHDKIMSHLTRVQLRFLSLFNNAGGEPALEHRPLRFFVLLNEWWVRHTRLHLLSWEQREAAATLTSLFTDEPLVLFVPRRTAWTLTEERTFVMMLSFVLVPYRAVITSALSLDKGKKNVSKVVRQKSRTRREHLNCCVLCCVHLLHFLLASRQVKGGHSIMQFSLSCCSYAHLVLSVVASSSAQSPHSSIHLSVRPPAVCPSVH